jgi:cytidine deaminase
MIPEDTLEEMRKVASSALKNSNSVGGGVGAAVLGASGSVYGGCSIMSIPQDVCAERVALYKALSEGEKRVDAVLIMRKKSRKGAKGSPCGHCLQDLWNLSNNADLLIFTWHGNKKRPSAPKTLNECLPYPYTPRSARK